VRTSTPKTAPARGVPKTEANPAEMPQTTSFFRSTPSNRSSEAAADISPAPICAQGPSFPADPPEARVRIVATSLTGTTPRGIRPSRRWIASMTFSVPCPAASGAKNATSPQLRNRPSGSSA